VLRVLKEVDLIAAENTLHTQKLLSHYGIKKPMISYFESEKKGDKENLLVQKLKEGLNIAQLTSAGTPLLSDPGFGLVKKCIAQKIPVVSLPGPNAAISALIVSGLPPYPFFFGGFLPAKSQARGEALQGVADYSCTLVFYEAPHRLRQSLQNALEILGNRQAALARELTKIHEEIIRGTLSEILAWALSKEVKGEITLVIAGKAKSQQENREANEEKIKEELKLLINQGVSVSDAVRRVAKKIGVSKNQIYAMAHHLFP